MLVKDLLTTDQTLFSFEFFPPKKDEDWDTKG
jgi:5,10-methylenetetrahydrofolate reductase